MRKTFITFFTVLMVLMFSCAAFGADAGKLKISVLADDKAISDKYMAEHAVSILVELPNGNRWLVDTGTTNVYMENAKIMGANLDNLKGIIISHGHDDHGGGLLFYPRLKGKPPIYGHPYIWHKSYEAKAGEPVRVIGIPYLARKYAAPSFRPLNNTVKLDDDFYFFTDIPRPSGSFVASGGKFFNEDLTGPDPIIDDATVVVKTPRGLVVIFGCGHAGYTNILTAIHKEFPKEKLLSVIGGLHLIIANEKALAEAAAYTNSIKADDFSFYGGHCTGDNAIKYFRTKFGEKAIKGLGSGRVITF
jgi:7,8-dihydropterin-6-yl-methyl-4-(beta-D-ribofuranosyl)aminobenzene 5'-phosphate synthase